MTSRSPTVGRRRAGGDSAKSEKNSQARPPERHSQLVRRDGALLAVPGKLMLTQSGEVHRLTKLLLKVTVQRSLGPVQVVISSENTVADLIRSALEIYVKEKRRPLLIENDPRHFELHYSQFSLESLKQGEKLTDLGSRNFFLCPKPTNSLNLSCSDEAKKAAQSGFPLTEFMDLLL